MGPETFLHDRAFSDVMDRLGLIDRQFDRTLLVGALNSSWAARLAERVGTLETIDPSPVLARASDGKAGSEDMLEAEPGSLDLIVSIGTLDTIEALPEAFARLRFALREGGLLIGAMSGGDSLPLLRACMAQADAIAGYGAPHVHPRIDPASLTQLLSNAGLAMPVVDVDEVTVRYSSFERLIEDLRAMGATNILSARPRKPLSRTALAAAKAHFAANAAHDGKSEERFDILHFMGWAPPLPQNKN
ncbi:MAG: SAM-dependent methyltransferase [Sphingomonas sp.]|nr:SAM-dependent methyltransferase [Sphingomonas sp.]